MEAIKRGISPEGGLFVPSSIPVLKADELASLAGSSYHMLASAILSLYLTDYGRDDLDECISSAYNCSTFSSEAIAPVISLKDGLHVLELWHGPTCAFKDMALQILPRLMVRASIDTNSDKETVILTATSGDTGKAALEGFKDVPGTRIIVFYPQDGVSPMQELQMITQEGNNIRVVAVNGNFDDTQTGVKRIFGSAVMNEELNRRGLQFSSANSINWGRLVPQIVYYFSAYFDMVEKDAISMGQPVNVVVPTGNFGNILAAYYAKKMGLPINRLICASNDNNVLYDFIKTGVYDRKRSFYKTISPSMDILISSNLERLLFELSGRDEEQVSNWMQELTDTGKYRIDGNPLRDLQSLFWAGYATEEQTRYAIKEAYVNYGYTLDTHTAVGKWVYDSYKEEIGDDTETILVSTASPFKFPHDVLTALRPDVQVADDDLLQLLSDISGMPIPKPLQGLTEKPILHQASCDIDSMDKLVLEFLGM